MNGTVYRIEVKYPETAIWLSQDLRNEWITPRFAGPGCRPTDSLAAARGILTRYRKEVRPYNARFAPEVRIIALTGTWEPLDEATT